MISRILGLIKTLLSKDSKWWKTVLKANFRNPIEVFKLFYYNIKRKLFDIGARFGFYQYKYNVIFIAGMPLSATTWVKNLFGRVPGYFTRYTPMSYDIAVNRNIAQSAFKYVPTYGYTIFKTHLNPEIENLNIITNNDIKKIIVTMRDFRDVAVSRYYRLATSTGPFGPKKKGDPHYVDLSKMTKEEAINESIKIVAEYYVDWIDGWLSIGKEREDFVYFCEFENLRNNTAEEFKKMLMFYEIELSEDKINQIVNASAGKGKMQDNNNKAVLQPWALSSNFRSGVVGGWRKEFTENNIKYCKEMLGQALVKHGYEKDDNW